MPDKTLAAALRETGDPDRVATAYGLRPSEVTIRLVELRLGALGRVRPHRSRCRPGREQPPVLGLAANVLGNSLQKLGDRLFHRGEEVTLPEIVMRARAKGADIRYPGIDPMDAAMVGGPSRQDSRRGRKAEAFWEQSL